ncbi:MAG: hypothetical protein KIT22_00660 [Verrucomicrobiae bacterium]|nr:hypothetical protein [Verrucomicrobiae bacterium]
MSENQSYGEPVCAYAGRGKASPSEVLHMGDNQQSDFLIPRRLGIRAQLFTKTKLTRAEANVSRTDNHALAMNHIAGAMRAGRLSVDPGDNVGINELVSQFIGPFAMGFACWVLRRAQEGGVKRLYFMSRDCQLVCKIARELAPQFGGIDCQYLYVSRQALYLPSTESVSIEGMPWMRRDFETPRLRNLLAKLELEFEDVKSAFPDSAPAEGESWMLKSEDDWARFWQAISRSSIKGLI